VAAAPSDPWGNVKASGGRAVLAPPLYRVSFTQSPGGGEDEDEDGDGEEDDEDGDSGGGGAGPLQRAAGAFAAGDLQRLGTRSSGGSGSRASELGLAVQAAGRQPGVPWPGRRLRSCPPALVAVAAVAAAARGCGARSACCSRGTAEARQRCTPLPR
jgi:hypothetical protein